MIVRPSRADAMCPTKIGRQGEVPSRSDQGFLTACAKASSSPTEPARACTRCVNVVTTNLRSDAPRSPAAGIWWTPSARQSMSSINHGKQPPPRGWRPCIDSGERYVLRSGTAAGVDAQRLRLRPVYHLAKVHKLLQRGGARKQRSPGKPGAFKNFPDKPYARQRLSRSLGGES
jgi:hypothetical protein